MNQSLVMLDPAAKPKISSEVVKYDKNDPKLQKLVELVYSNLRKRFQVLANAYCYLDFKNRDGVSLKDWLRGLEGFAIKIMPEDAK